MHGQTSPEVLQFGEKSLQSIAVSGDDVVFCFYICKCVFLHTTTIGLYDVKNNLNERLKHFKQVEGLEILPFLSFIFLGIVTPTCKFLSGMFSWN